MKLLVSIIGPTGVGKTKISIKLAKIFNCEIISCDSRQFYKELKIGTSRPPKKELKNVKHHFIGHKSIFDNYNVYNYYRDAYKKIKTLYKHHNIVILVGGSLLYEKSIIEGINYIPNIDNNKLTTYRKKLYKKSYFYLLKKLKKKDFYYYKYILTNKKDKRKIIRALEVNHFLKKKISFFLKKKKKEKPFDKYIRIGLIDYRKKIYNNINKRVDKMINDGLVDEVKNLYQFKKLNTLNTIGYKEFFLYNKLYNIILNIKKNTRNYARKQIIWLRKIIDIKWFTPNKIKDIKNYILDIYNC